MTTPTQVLIDVALPAKVFDAIGRWVHQKFDPTEAQLIRHELAALIPTDPMAEAREVWEDAYTAYLNNRGRADAAVEVIHTALNAPSPDASVDGLAEAFTAARSKRLQATGHLADQDFKAGWDAALAAQFQPARKGDG